MTKKIPQPKYITLQQWFDNNPAISDVAFGKQMVPAVTHVCVQKWRKGETIPRRHFMPQIFKATGGWVHASTFYF